jgi:hypothetical protein
MASTYSGQKWSVINKSSDYTLLRTDYVVNFNTTAAPRAATLPAGEEGMAFIIRNSGTGILTITPDGAELINEESTLVSSNQFDSIELTFDGATWGIM